MSKRLVTDENGKDGSSGCGDVSMLTFEGSCYQRESKADVPMEVLQIGTPTRPNQVTNGSPCLSQNQPDPPISRTDLGRRGVE